MADVCNDMMGKMGLHVDYQAMDWGTLVQRRTSTKPVGEGGWSVFGTFWSGLDQYNPAVNAFLRANGRDAAPGWPDDPKLERMRDSWFAAPDLAAQQTIAVAMQREAFHAVPYIPLGLYLNPTAFRRDIVDLLPGQPVFWNVRRA